MTFREGRERVRDCIAEVVDSLPEEKRRQMFDAISDDLVDAEVSRDRVTTQAGRDEFQARILQWKDDARDAWTEKRAYSVRVRPDLRLVTEREFAEMSYGPKGGE